MMKIVASLVILGLCANVCFGAAPVSSSQSGAFSSSVLNSTATKVLSVSNASDALVWDSSTANSSTANATSAGVSDAWFGPGATNDTSYLWGIQGSAYSYSATTGANTVTSIRRRAINNTIVGWGNDTMEASVIADTAITTAIGGYPSTQAIGPGYTFIVSVGSDGATSANQQVWITLVSGVAGSAQSTKLTSTADVKTGTATTGCTTTSYMAGNAWYDIGTGSFFYTYSKNVMTQVANSSYVGNCSMITASQTTNVYLGALFLNNTALWSAGPLTVSAATAGNMIDTIIAGGDNTLMASNIYIVYKDSTAGITYWSKTAIANTTTAVGAFSSLIKDTTSGTTTTVAMSYIPVTVWSSNFTYGVTLSNVTVTVVTTATTPTPSIMTSYLQYYNGSSTGVDSGFAGASGAITAGFWGWQLNTGYTIVAAYETSSTTSMTTTFTLGTFYGNGTVNASQVSIGSLMYGSPNFYEDVNGTQWIGWFDVDTANGEYVYAAYLAKFQGQLNIASGVNVFATLSIVAIFLASIFIF